MRTSPVISSNYPNAGALKPGTRTAFIADSRLVLMLVAEGQNLVRMTSSAGWPARRIQLLASRHGYLFTEAGFPYKPPGPRRATSR